MLLGSAPLPRHVSNTPEKHPWFQMYAVKKQSFVFAVQIHCLEKCPPDTEYFSCYLSFRPL